VGCHYKLRANVCGYAKGSDSDVPCHIYAPHYRKIKTKTAGDEVRHPSVVSAKENTHVSNSENHRQN